jgi:hypothetical protein
MRGKRLSGKFLITKNTSFYGFDPPDFVSTLYATTASAFILRVNAPTTLRAITGSSE